MREPVINSLFPIPIYMTHIDRQFTKKELDFVESQKNYSHNNVGNSVSNNNYILNKPQLKNIKIFLQQCCDYYLQTVICPNKDLKLYITQSWLNYTEENKYHHIHSHPNSIISGVLYFNCDEQNDKIKFTNPKNYNQIKPEIKEYNIWNSETWWFPLQTGQLLMFPSSTVHQVDTKKGLNTRTSLAFNTFYKGKLGTNNKLTELIL
tara:strand:+ start:3049 stop:3666 length:618 start_codon:yes stop_codon:yes gene_type:complete